MALARAVTISGRCYPKAVELCSSCVHCVTINGSGPNTQVECALVGRYGSYRYLPTKQNSCKGPVREECVD